MDLRLADIGEAGLLARLGRLLGRPWRRAGAPTTAPAWALGVGDDAALLPQAGGCTVACCDWLVEDVDFRRRWARFADVGHKAAAVNLSDLAAMGATGTGLLLGLALSPAERVTDVLALVRAVHRVGCRYGAPLVGGDLSTTRGPMVVGVTALGSCAPPGLRRGMARLGDVVVVTGTLGAARAGLALLEGELEAGAWQQTPWAQALVSRQLRPTPHLAAGAWLARAAGVHAATDVSDGLVQDAAHLCAPPLGIVLDADALPLARGVRAAAQRAPASACAAHVAALAKQWALGGGEDFVLAAAVAASAWPALRRQAAAAGFALHAVGRVRRGRGVHVEGRAAMATPLAYDHFALR